MDRGAWQAAYSPWRHKELDTTEQLSTLSLKYYGTEYLLALKYYQTESGSQTTTKTGHMLDTQAVVVFPKYQVYCCSRPSSNHSYQAYFTFPRTAAGLDGA